MLFLKALAGALIVVALSLLAESKRFFFLAGLVPLFPTFALIGQILVYRQQGETAVKEIALVGIYSLFPYLVFLLGIYFLTEKLGYPKACIISVALWLISALPIVFKA